MNAINILNAISALNSMNALKSMKLQNHVIQLVGLTTSVAALTFQVTVLNPWESNTLEWTTPIRPGHGNWPGEIPEVHRWPYDYGKDGHDFIPQTTPVGEDEKDTH